MQFLSNEWAGLIFKRTEHKDITRYKIDIRLKNVYWAIDGVRTLGDIASEGMYEPKALLDMIEKLVDLGFVIIAQGNSETMDRGFFDFLTDLLAKEIGPMGEIVLEDALGNLGFGINNFPDSSLPKLIDRLALEIGDARKAAVFKNTIAAELKRRKK
jgi:hypothetical protein